MIVSGVSYSYTELAERAATMGGALHASGVRQGDRLAAMMGNRVELVDVLLGCAWIGAVAVPLNPELRGDSLTHVLGDSVVRHMIAEGAHAERVRELGYRDRLWVLGNDDAPRPGICDAIAPADIDPLDTAMVLFTSGTTGPPKGVRCPHAQNLFWGESVGRALELAPGDVLFNCLPLFHTNAINTLFQAFVAGATASVGTRFSVRRHWHDAAETGATVMYLLGAMVAMLDAAPVSDSDRAHSVRRALSPATPAHLHSSFGTRFGVTLIDGFGSTETNFVVGNSLSELRPGYLGKVRPGYDARVVDGDTPVPDGSAGELEVRSCREGAFATGYLGEAEPDPRSWRRTGDRVIRESDGWFRFVDRIKEVIRRRGENISSAEVEGVLSCHPDVIQVAVYPVPSDLAEDEVMAAVVLRPGSELDPADLLRFGEPQLPYFALPRYVDVVDVLPLTETGKVRKTELTATGVGADTWDAVLVGYLPTRTT